MSSSYSLIIEKIFFNHYAEGSDSFAFDRDEIEAAARSLNVDLPKNLGDVIYAFRFRRDLPGPVIETQPAGQEWIIELAGKGRYRFSLVKVTRIVPREDLVTIDIPDATPELIRAYALDDEQALLAVIRYNRLIDTFSGPYDLQPTKPFAYIRSGDRPNRNRRTLRRTRQAWVPLRHTRAGQGW